MSNRGVISPGSCSTRSTGTVPVPDFESEAGRIRGLAGDVRREDRLREKQAILVRIDQMVGPDPLTSKDAVDVDQEKVDTLQIGMSGRK